MPFTSAHINDMIAAIKEQANNIAKIAEPSEAMREIADILYPEGYREVLDPLAISAGLNTMRALSTTEPRMSVNDVLKVAVMAAVTTQALLDVSRRRNEMDT